VRDDVQKFASRVEALMRNESMNKMQLRNFKNQIKQKIEEAQLSRSFKFEAIGIDEPGMEGVLSQITEESFNIKDFKANIVKHLVELDHLVSHESDIKTLP